MPNWTIVQAINHALHVAMAADERVVVLGEDVGVNGGVFRVTEGLHDQYGDRRVFDTPLAEGGIIGTAIGMAVYGLRPVPEIQFTGFLPMAFDHLVSHASRVRWRSRGRFHCPLVLRMPYGAGIHAPEHHSESHETFYAHTPGLKVVIPATPYDAKGLLLAAIRDPDPVLFFEPKRIYRAFRQDVPEDDYEVPLGQARVVREGADLTAVCWGSMAHTTRAAAETAAEERGIDVEVVDLRTIAPLDVDTVVRSVEKTGRCVIVQEAPRTLGFAAELTALIHDRAFGALEAPVVRVSGFDTAVPYFRMEETYLPGEGRVLRGFRQALAF